MVFVLSRENSVVNRFLLELRDTEIQQDRMRFRTNLERLGEILAYEISKTLDYRPQTVHSPLGTLTINDLAEVPVLICILRAGIPFLQGFQHIFDRAAAGFIGAYRDESHHELTINMEYSATPDLNKKNIIITDPMLATGESLVSSVKNIMKKGTPARIDVASVIAAPEGVTRVSDFLTGLDIPFNLWMAAVDESLNDKFYIVPGLGDAGDLSFGEKTS